MRNASVHDHRCRRRGIIVTSVIMLHVLIFRATVLVLKLLVCLLAAIVGLAYTSRSRKRRRNATV